MAKRHYSSSRGSKSVSRASKSREREGEMVSHRRPVSRHHSSGSNPRDMGHHSPMDGHGSPMFQDGDYRHPKFNPEERSKHQYDEFNDQNYADRGGERAVYRRFRALGDEVYAGMEPRRRQEMEDAGYIHEDHSKIANLPQYPIIKSYPHVGPYLAEGLEDSINGVDHQMEYDDEQREAHFYPKKV